MITRWTILLIAALAVLTASTSPAISQQPPMPAGRAQPASSDDHPDSDEAGDRLVLAPGSQFSLTGEASIGSWDSTSRKATGAVTVPLTADQLDRFVHHLEAMLKQGAAPTADDLRLPTDQPARALITLPVETLECDSSGMKRDLRKALKSTDHPDILYVFDAVRGARLAPAEQKADSANGDASDKSLPLQIDLTVAGRLTVAGITRRVTTTLRLTHTPLDPAAKIAQQRFHIVGDQHIEMPDYDVTPPSALFGLIRAHPGVDIHFDLTFQAPPPQPPVQAAK